MPLYAILHSDIEGLHDHSCTLVSAASSIEIAQQMLAHPHRWQPLLARLYPDDADPRSLWQRMQMDTLTPEALLALIGQTYCDDAAEMLRIQAVEIQSLDHIQVETRWVTAHAPDCFLDGAAETMHSSTVQAHVPEMIEQLLSAYTDLRQRKGKTLSAQLAYLRQQIISELQFVRQQEVEFTAQQTHLLEHLRRHLAIDARALLATPDFERFVHSMFVPTKSGSLSLPLQVARMSRDWTITTLPHPLQLKNIQMLPRSGDSETHTFVVQMQASLGDWSQLIAVPVEKLQDGTLSAYEAAYTSRQWLEVGVQLQQNLPQLPINPNLRLPLGQELVCLIAYIGELFNVAGVVDRLANLQL